MLHIVFVLCLIASSFAAAEVPAASIKLGVLQRLTSDKNSIAPVFSPTDGNLLAFTHDQYAGVYLLHIRRSLSTEGEKITAAATDALDQGQKSGFGFSWAGNGEQIIFRSEQTNGTAQVKAVQVRTKEVTALSEPEESVSVPTAHSYGVFFTHSARGTRLPLPGMRQSMANAPVIEDNDGQLKINGAPLNPTNDACWLPRLSPVGDKLSFECWSGLYIYDLTQKHRIHIGPGSNAHWAADGRRLVYEQTQDDGHIIRASDIFMVNADGSNKILLTAEQSAIIRRPSLSPDGTRIAVDMDGDIYVAEINP